MVEAAIGYQCRTCASTKVRPQGEAQTAHARRRRGKVLSSITAVAILAGGAGAVLWLGQQPRDAGTARADTELIIHQPDRSSSAPANNPEGYALLASDAQGRPIRFNPCEPLEYVVNPTGAPPDALTALNHAITEVSKATGIEFVPAGQTSEKPSVGRPNSSRKTYGDRWSPVLIAWDALGRPTETQGISAIGGPGQPVRSQGRYLYVTGFVTMNTDAPMSAIDMKATLMHELGHLLGLDHIDDAGQIMNPSGRSDSQAVWGQGDLAGLAAVGREAGCLTTPLAPGQRRTA
ncbi:MAG: matrixin family metalloprotease [Actinomycetota bacterium]